MYIGTVGLFIVLCDVHLLSGQLCRLILHGNGKWPPRRGHPAPPNQQVVKALLPFNGIEAIDEYHSTRDSFCCNESDHFVYAVHDEFNTAPALIPRLLGKPMRDLKHCRNPHCGITCNRDTSASLKMSQREQYYNKWHQYPVWSRRPHPQADDPHRVDERAEEEAAEIETENE